MKDSKKYKKGCLKLVLMWYVHLPTEPQKAPGFPAFSDRADNEALRPVGSAS